MLSHGYFVINGEHSLIYAKCAKFNINAKAYEGCYPGYTLLEGKFEILKNQLGIRGGNELRGL